MLFTIVNVFCWFLLQAAMQTSDSQGAAVYTNGSPAHVNGSELSRMKEVAFEKSPSEPMVTEPPKRHTIRNKTSNFFISFFSTIVSVQAD